MNSDGTRAGAMPTAAEPVQLRLLGTWSLSCGLRSPAPLAVRRLVTYLALRGPRSRSEIAAALWPDATEARAHGSLRTALWRVRSVHPRLVRADATWVSLHPGVRVDVDELVDDLRCLDAGVCPPRLRTLPPQLLDGELAPGWYDEWLLVERERVRQLRLHALESLAVQLAAQSRFGLAVEAALAAVRAEPLRESAHRVLLQVHLAEGNRSEALRHFDEYRRLLGCELGVSPGRTLLEVLRNEVPGQRRPSIPTTFE